MTVASHSVWDRTIDLLFPEPNPYVLSPSRWIREYLGEDIWSGQEWMANAVVEKNRVVVKAGHSVGKTRLLSRLIAWFVSVHPPGEALVVVTADNFDQITGAIWRELIILHEERKALAERKNDPSLALPGRVTLDAKWHAGPSNKVLVAVGKKPSDKNPTGIQGYHARNLLVIIEECCGVPKELWEAADSLASNEGATVFAVGNPTDPTAYMAEVCKPGSGWTVKKIASIDTPEFTGESVSPTLQGVLASKTWVESRKIAWGESSPTYISRILGEFPDISDDTLIHPKWIKAAQDRTVVRDFKPNLGIDIARYGSDETVIYRNENGWVRLVATYAQNDTMQTAGHIIKIIREMNADKSLQAWVSSALDEVGVGAGVLDRLVEQNVEVRGLNGGSEPADKRSYLNARAEWYWTLRLAFERGEVDIDANDDKLAAQLGSIKWTVNSKGRIQIESKDDMRKRNMPSPDRADALCYSFVRGATTMVDPASHEGETLTGDLLEMGW